jgi:hypothetical protein
MPYIFDAVLRHEIHNRGTPKLKMLVFIDFHFRKPAMLTVHFLVKFFIGKRANSLVCKNLLSISINTLYSGHLVHFLQVYNIEEGR